MSTAKVKKSRTLIGKVISDKRDKTRTVIVEWSMRHPVLEKVMKKITKLHVHDENNASNLGDKVAVEECRPVSKTKSWKLVSVVEAAK